MCAQRTVPVLSQGQDSRHPARYVSLLARRRCRTCVPCGSKSPRRGLSRCWCGRHAAAPGVLSTRSSYLCTARRGQPRLLLSGRLPDSRLGSSLITIGSAAEHCPFDRAPAVSSRASGCWMPPRLQPSPPIGAGPIAATGPACQQSSAQPLALVLDRSSGLVGPAITVVLIAVRDMTGMPVAALPVTWEAGVSVTGRWGREFRSSTPRSSCRSTRSGFPWTH
jgi:hypothetical protein